MWKLIPYLKNYKEESIIGPLFKLLEAVFELIVPLITAQIIDVGIRQRDMVYIWKMATILVAFGVFGLICSLLAQYFAAKAAVGFGTELRHDLFEHISKLSYSELDQIGISTLVVRMIQDINQVQSGVNLVLRLFLRSPFIVIGAVIMAFAINVRLAVIFVVAVPLLSFVIYGIMLWTIPLYKKVQHKLDEVLLSTRENLTGIRVIRAFCTQKREQKEYEEKSEQLMKLQLFVGKISALLNPVTYMLVNAGIIAVVWFGGKQTNNGLLTQGEVVALINYMTQILLALLALSTLIVSFTKAIASAGRINEVFQLKTSVKDGSGANTESSIHVPRVEMKSVSFAYEKHTQEVISNLNFTAMAGETIGIIGGTGSGKSTVVNLISRFYDVTKGAVFIDGNDVRTYRLQELREKIGIVPQKAVLFAGTIRSNLQMRKENATEEEMIWALKTAQAWEFVKEKPGGLDFAISEGGKNLSGGQRQRLTIARALVGHPEILILDDSASALDFATDAKLRKALSEETGDMTVFLVSQRTASIMNANKIIVLDDGEIVGYGTHQELLESCTVYQEIYHSQFSKEGK